MDPVQQQARVVLNLGLGLIAFGLSLLLLNAWVEFVRTPGISIVDAYWIGREPWTSLGVWAVIIGASDAVLSGSLVAIVVGSWIRKVLALVALAPSVLWWSVALGLLPFPRYQAVEPTTLAYSLPESAALLLLLPALLAAALALAPRRDRPSSRMAPVHEGRSSKEGTPGL